MNAVRLAVNGMSKSYPSGGGRTGILRDIDLTVAAGEIVWVTGPSGSGKTTLINVAGLLTRPTAGTVAIDGRDLTHAPDRTATAARARQLGMIFQSHNLLPELSAKENVMMAAVARGGDAAAELLDQVGLGQHQDARAKTLSGGQQQRVAIARALINLPALLLADEPTSGLDRENADIVLSAIQTAAASGCGVLISSHDQAVAGIADRRLNLESGVIVDDGRDAIKPKGP